MSDLNSLNETRKDDDSVIIKDAQEDQEQAHIVPEYKGIYFLSFLMILLIGFSVISLSISLKTFTQLEASWADSKTILETLRIQHKDIAVLHTLIADGAAEELAYNEDLKAQINELKAAIKNSEDEFSKMHVAYSDWKVSTQGLIEELKLSDELMLKEYTLLNDQFEKFSKESISILNY